MDNRDNEIMPIKQSIALQDTVSLLNEMLDLDAKATYRLISFRVACNKDLGDHPTIQILDVEGQDYVGLLGVLNGLFGVDEEDYGAIAAVYDNGELMEFIIRC